jgi:DNA-binding NtrC family response regulator
VADREKAEVLILDEEPNTLMDLFDRIYEEGFSTTGVSTPGEAVRLADRRKPDFLIDHLHGADRKEIGLLEQIKKLSPKTHIILMGDRQARPSGFDQTLKDRNVDWVPEDPEDAALIEALERATAGGGERQDGKAGLNEPKERNS